MTTTNSCRVCLSQDLAPPFAVREMMYGTREAFDYRLCNLCGSLQIAEVPAELSRFYPSDYYSMQVPSSGHGSAMQRLKRYLNARRDENALVRQNVVGSIFGMIRPAAAEIKALAVARPGLNDTILDLGCGSSAHLLRTLAGIGFNDLTGADPFIASDQTISPGLRLFKCSTDGLSGPYKVVMLHHSFEHLPEPRAAISEISRLLATGGTCILRVPTVSSEAFERYGANWVQLDAPRHLNIPSRSGIEMLAHSAGLVLSDTIDDSNLFQFSGSELYSKDIPLSDAAAHPHASSSLSAWKKEVRDLNAQNRGDQAAFILRKP